MKLKILIFICILFSIISYSQTYVYSIKLSRTLATTAAASPSLYKQNIFELKEFANNTAALDGGLKIGMFYSLPITDDTSLIAVVKPRQVLTKGSIANVTSYMSKEK
jgi:hypothetical protein